MTIGDRLKEERSRLGLSQTDLAAVGGVGKTTQINYEKGSGSPDARYLAAAADRGVDILYVVTGVRRPAHADQLSPEGAELLHLAQKINGSDLAILVRMASAFAVANERA
ncbi:helix-turn-helix domain-containing protein [Pseudomonas putida]|uniref:helix-turn-helix domain-containing protein n=1 Tax=Pseudomonas putida TaxID=303 RepID=UPI0009A15AFA|nr:helix-turn-helix transcriptional regulator [Pseudomonas putida]